MPKGKHKKRSARMDGISDEDSFNDNASVASTISGSTVYEDTNISDDMDNNQQNEIFEDKLSEAIEGMFEKSFQSRVSSFEFVVSALMKRFIPDIVNRRRLTIIDAIERSLKKGRGSEQAIAAQLAALLCVQLGSTNVIDEICQNLIPLLLLIVSDGSMSCIVRAKCCWALSILNFIGDYDDFDSVMDALRHTFNLSTKHSSSNSNHNADEITMHTAALSAWCLLLTVSPSTDSFLLYLQQIVKLLDSNSVEIRMAVGEIIAVMLEQLRDFGNEIWQPDENLISKLKELATDSHKFRAKKDRKTQRSVFRDIIRYIEDGEFPKMQVRFGQECLSLDSWRRKKQYDTFRQALGSGMNLHLKENDLLREILNLGNKVTTLPPALYKQNKIERHVLNVAAFKARSICRAKHRDKRIVSIS